MLATHALRGRSTVVLLCTDTLINYKTGGHDSRLSVQITAVCVSRSGDRIYTASLDRTVRAWNMTTGKDEVLYRGHNDSVMCVVQSHMHLLITGGLDRKAVAFHQVMQLSHCSLLSPGGAI